MLLKTKNLNVTIFLAFAVFFWSQQTIAENLDKCRYKIGKHIGKSCICKEGDQLKCDLMRTKEIIMNIQRNPKQHDVINDLDEFEQIIDSLLKVNAIQRSAKLIKEVINETAHSIIINNYDFPVLEYLVINYAKMADYANYYGRIEEGLLYKVLYVYKNVERSMVERFREFEKRKFIRLRLGGNFSLLRTTIYKIDRSALSRCPDVILRNKPDLCEIYGTETEP